MEKRESLATAKRSKKFWQKKGTVSRGEVGDAP